MHLTPGDQERLMLALAGIVARDRQARGIKLNYPEAIAILTSWVIERAREGVSVAELMQLGREVLGPDDVMPGVADLITEVQVEAMFPMDASWSPCTTPSPRPVLPKDPELSGYVPAP